MSLNRPHSTHDKISSWHLWPLAKDQRYAINLNIQRGLRCATNVMST